MFVYSCKDKSALTMRPIDRKDLEFLRCLRNDPTTWQHLCSVSLINEVQQERWFQSLSNTSKQFYSIDNEHGQIIGVIKTDQIDHCNKSICIGLDIARDFRGQGYGRKAYEMLLCFCFNFLGMHRVWLEVLNTNSIGRSLYAKMGFQEEGRLREAVFRDGKYLDIVLMSLLKQEYLKVNNENNPA